MATNNISAKGLLLGALLTALVSADAVRNGAVAEVSANPMSDFTMYPLLSTETAQATPLVMITASNDHQLYFKAYDDHSDLDGDGKLEVTYKHSIDYYGYFDSYKCYDYSSTRQRFEPQAVTSDKYCDTVSGSWSGNFLNWATMARIDAIRKILFGGHRRVDEGTSTDSDSDGSTATTVLERTHIPPDIHSFAKHYDGVDLPKLTPYSIGTYGTSITSTTVSGYTTSSDSFSAGATTTFTVVNGAALNSGDFILVRSKSTPGNFMQGNITTLSGNSVTMSVSSSNHAGGANNDWEVIPRKQLWPATGSWSTNDNIKVAVTADPSTYMVGDVYMSGGWIYLYVTGASNPGATAYSAWTINTNKTTGTSTTSRSIGTGSKSFTVSPTGTWIKKGDYLEVKDSANSANYMRGWVTAYTSSTGAVTVDVTATGGSGTKASWKITDHTRTGVTLCNTTWQSGTVYSQNVTSPPLVRVAQGNYAFWAAGEVNQCLWEGEDGNSTFRGGNGANYNDPELSDMYAAQDRPYSTDVGASPYGDYVVRVQACLSSLLGQEKCKLYPNGNYKPIGLLQQYGDEEKLWFGMAAGTFGKHKTGGDMMARVKDQGGGSTPKTGTVREINVNTDGTFYKVYSSVGGPETNASKSEGIINTWSLYRIYGYKYGSWNYTATSSGGDNCPLSVNFFGAESDSKCSNWGNPFAEIYLTALRYFAGENAPQAYQSGDGSYINGINYASGTWVDPIDSTNYCARLNIVAFNSSISTTDADELDTSSYGVVTDMGSPKTSSEWTDVIGVGESIHGNSYFVGQNGTDNNNRCTAKTVTSLGAVKGLCPEGGDLEGSFRVGGLSYFAHITDIRPDNLSGNRGVTGEQRVDTYAVSFATGAPIMNIPVPNSVTGQTVKLMPACQTQNKNYYSCSLVDFKVVAPHSESGGIGTGKFLAIWEDSLQGNDYDLDLGGIYEYTITPTQITVKTAVTLKNLGYSAGHGYIISGTTKDGLHIHSGANGFDYPGGSDPTGVTACNNCYKTDGETSVTYTIGSSSAGLLKDPLWYAAKWGGFTDKNGNDKPDLTAEWDAKDSEGAANPDGIPDNYFYAANPAQLENSLRKVFDAILAKTASGTAAAVVANSREGLGAVYQALYETSKTDSHGNEAKWFGNLHTLWVDKAGYLREDGDGDAVLDGYNTDQVVDVYYDTVEGITKVRRYTSTSDSTFSAASYLTVPLTELRPLWSARDQLKNLSASSIATQRSYTASADNGRYILTWVDADLDGVVDSGEVKDFSSATFTSSNFGFLDVANEAAADNLVDWIRGKEITGYRGRTIDYDEDGTTEVMRLGDIVNSTPTVVGAPSEAFDLLYGDTSYATFRKFYANRRQMAYVGANDGMLHAFNAGFYDVQGKRFLTRPLLSDGTADSSYTPHPLGSEVWAYVPMNLHPHLKWLPRSDYTHVYYMDAKPRVFDAKIFSDTYCPATANKSDADYNAHVCGWGTVLLMGMNFGGGPITVDTAGDGLGSPHASDDRERRSAYVLLDITDPDSPPTLIAELTHANMGFTTPYPTAMAVRATGGTPNGWYLVFGTGPNVISTATSTQSARALIYDLVAGNWVTNFGPGDSANILESNAFVGAPVVADWDLDFKADDIYFGTVGGSISAPTGKLYKIKVGETTTTSSWVGPSVFFNAAQPLLTTPTLAYEGSTKRWVFAGTGRMFVEADKASTAQQALYGIKDIEYYSTAGTLPVATGDLLDVSSAEVLTNGTVHNVTDGATTVADFNGLETASDNNDGWKLSLTADGTNPAARNLVQFSLIGKVLLAPVYTPSTSQCGAEGNSTLFGLYYRTGTAFAQPSVFGTTTNVSNEEVSLREVDMGAGMASSPSVHTGSETGDDEITVFTQTSTGSIQRTSASTPGGVRSGETSWRELFE